MFLPSFINGGNTNMQNHAIEIFRVQDIIADKCPIGPRGADTKTPGRSDSEAVMAAFKWGIGHNKEV